MSPSLRSSSTRTFLVLPVLALTEARLRRNRLHPAWAPVMAAGYAVYRTCGTYRRGRGGGGPGMSVPPDRLVTTGPYAVSRNPMYLGHLVFVAGVAGLTHSVTGLAAAAVLPVWFDRRVRRDEQRLRSRFGASYDAYCAAVPRWLSAWRPLPRPEPSGIVGHNTLAIPLVLGISDSPGEST